MRLSVINDVTEGKGNYRESKDPKNDPFADDFGHGQKEIMLIV